MTHNIIKPLAAVALGAMLLTGCGKEQNIPQQSNPPTDNRTQSTSNSDTIPENASIVGDWEWESGLEYATTPYGTDTVVDVIYSLVKDVLFHADGTATLECQSGYCVYPPYYFEAEFGWSMNDNSDTVFMTSSDFGDTPWEIVELMGSSLTVRFTVYTTGPEAGGSIICTNTYRRR